jgi:SAM-dependent methyltransferase
MSPNVEQIKPKNEFYSGFLYAKVWDPVMSRTRQVILSQVPAKSSVIDIACGTGHQLLTMAPHIKHGMGIDISDRMVRYAVAQRKKKKIDAVSFAVGDATNLPQFKDKSFDIALSTLLLHEIPCEKRVLVLREMKRLAHTVIVADWGGTNPWGDIAIGSIEFSVGILHAHHYVSFRMAGGIPPLLEVAGLKLKKEIFAFFDSIRICICA